MKQILKFMIVVAAAGALAGCSSDNTPAPIEVDIPSAAKQITANDAVFEANPTLSPDGAWILYESDAGGSRDIWLMAADGGAPVRLTDHGAFDSAPAWLPDGNGIVFESDRSGSKSIWYLDLGAEGAQPVALTDDGGEDGSPAVSPDGLRIVFESNRAKWGGTDLWLVGVAGGELARLTDTPVGTYHRSADWAPDGERIVCEANREEASSAIFVIDVKSGQATRLTRLGGYEGHPAWSPDGAAIAFEATWDGTSEIYVMGPGGEEPTRVTADGGFWPRWSPDGSELVYCVWNTPAPNIWIVPSVW
jgi:TolB protein